MSDQGIEQFKSPVKGIENREIGAHDDLAAGMELDSRFGQIKDELVKNWEKSHAPENILSAPGQDFQFGDPAALSRGEDPVSLEDRARRTFKDRFPADAEVYVEKEKVRIYERPQDDPAIREVEARVAEATGLHPDVRGVVSSGQGNYGEAWDRAQLHASMSEWKNFIEKYPEKAAAYRDKFEPIKWRLAGMERRKQREAERQEPLHTTRQERVNEQFALRQLGGNYDRVFQIQERVLMLQRESEKTSESLRDLQRSAGLPETDGDTASSRRLGDEREHLSKESRAITLLEQHYLDLDHKPVGESVEGSETPADQLIEKARKVEKAAEKTKELLKKEREKFIGEFIKDSTEQMIRKFEEQFHGSENGERAKKLLAVKIWHTIINSEKDWIETGEGRGELIGLRASLGLRKYTMPGERKEKRYIINIKVEMMGEKDLAEASELLKKQEEATLRQEERGGGVKREEKKS